MIGSWQKAGMYSMYVTELQGSWYVLVSELALQEQ